MTPDDSMTGHEDEMEVQEDEDQLKDVKMEEIEEDRYERCAVCWTCVCKMLATPTACVPLPLLPFLITDRQREDKSQIVCFKS